MTQTGWRLERTYVAGAGFPESRMEGLDLTWSDPLEPTGHAALWADNGTGKTTITALRYALYRPNARDFIRGASDRSLAKLVRSGDVCHVVEQATRVVYGELQRLVVGMVADWPDGGTQDLENPSRLNRTFYGWLAGADGPTIDDLPLRTNVGRWASRAHFVNTLREIMPSGGAVPPHKPSERQGEWQQWLESADVDIEQIRFQTVMNATEGGVDRVMQFADSDAFVRWLVGATMSTNTVEQITKSIDRLRENAAARPSWEDELRLWERIIDPLLNLAIAHEQVQTNHRAVRTAEADAAALLADTDATVKELSEQQRNAQERYEQHEKRRRDAATDVRRARAHRLRMQLRAEELQLREAEEAARAQKRQLDEASRVLAAWRSVADVVLLDEMRSALTYLEEQRDAATLNAERLGQEEKRHSHALARLLTAERDAASEELATAKRRKETADDAVKAADVKLQRCRTEYGTATGQHGLLRERARTSEQAISEAVAAGLLDEGADPAEVDASLNRRIAEERAARDRAEIEMNAIADEIEEAEHQKSAARRRAEDARTDAEQAAAKARDVTQRVNGVTSDRRLLDVVSDPQVKLWDDRAALTEALRQCAENADADIPKARDALTAAERIVNSVGADGLLPPSAVVERAVQYCQEAEVVAWPGWRWLADTMTSEDAVAFARARPEIASGVVVAHPDLVGHAVDVVRGINSDTALWVGAVVDPDSACDGDESEGDAGTWAHVLLPPAGVFDRDEAQNLVTTAEERRARAKDELASAKERANDARSMLAKLEQFWTSLPADPRPQLDEKIRAAGERKRTAEQDAKAADEKITNLTRRRTERKDDYHVARAAVEEMGETRLKLAPVIGAAKDLAEAKERLPEIREQVTALEEQIRDLESEQPLLAAAADEAREQVREWSWKRDDAAEKLRVARLTATTAGPLPQDTESVLRARLEAARKALDGAEVPSDLKEEIKRLSRTESEVAARLDADPERRVLAEELATLEGGRHPVARDTSIRQAQERENAAREEHAKANARVEQLKTAYQQRVTEYTDRSSPDITGFPPAETVAEPDMAKRLVRLLDDLVQQHTETERAEERLAKEQHDIEQRASSQVDLIAASVESLRHLADPTLSGRSVSDIQRLRERAGSVIERVRVTADDLSTSREQLRSQSEKVRTNANSPLARKVEDRGDPRIVDLIQRLRADNRLHTEAEHLASHLEQRIATLRDDLDNHKEHVRTCAAMLYLKADNALKRLRAYQNQSRLPAGLGGWSERNFVLIDHEPAPTDESVAVDRVARVIHAQLAPDAGRTDAQAMLFAATRALVDAPFRVRILKPHTDMTLDRVDVSDLKNFSGGQRVTAGVLLYATMTRVRGSGDETSIGWLWLDNPFGQASADQFVRTMRLAADKLGLQLVFTAAPKDKGALSMFDRVTVLDRRLRPSSGEKVIVVGKEQHELVDLTLIQRDVMAVLGQ